MINAHPVSGKAGLAPAVAFDVGVGQPARAVIVPTPDPRSLRRMGRFDGECAARRPGAVASHGAQRGSRVFALGPGGGSHVAEPRETAIAQQVGVSVTPTHAFWTNLVEVWFSVIERQAIHRGTYTSVKDLNAKIRAFIDGWNDRCHPFVWTKAADDILKKANRKTTSDTRH